MIDRCIVTTTDIIIGNVLLWTLYLGDFIFTWKNLELLKKLTPKKFMSYEKNMIYNYLVHKYGLNKGMVVGFLITTSLFIVILILFPFVTPLIIGFLICMVGFVHLPNYKDLKERLKLKGKKVRA